ncbi:MAG: class I SAM-dependent methyltransferase, partial [Clostridia bacterium]
MLDNRLSAAASAINKGEILLDIGADHAFLVIELVKKGIIPSGIASDLRLLPLEKGKENAAKYGISSIDFIISDGFENIEIPFDVASICGMGGLLITDIIKKGGKKAQKKLILQPMTAAEKLRAFLWENGYDIKNEIYAVEDCKPYAIICAEYDGMAREYSYTDTYIGKIRPSTKEFDSYKQKIRVSAQKRLRGALCTGKKVSDILRLID